jgi:hypothetical protein
MNTTVEDLLRDAWMKGIEPENVHDVFQSEGIELSLFQIREYYRYADMGCAGPQ